MARFAVLRIDALALAAGSVKAGPARASLTTTGDVDPCGDSIQPDPWAVGANLYVGKSGSGTLEVGGSGIKT